MRTIGMYLAVTCALLTVNAQSFPDPAKLLAAQADLMRNSSSVQYTQQTDMEMTVMGNPIKTSTKTRMQYAGEKFRMESGSGEPGSATMIFDGKTMWMYMPAEKQYSRMELGGAPDDLIKQMTSGSLAGNLPEILAAARNAKVLRSEAIEIDGQVHDCWVVEVKMDKIDVPAMAGTQMVNNVSTYWLDKQLGIAQRTIVSGKMEGIPGAGAMETSSTMTLHDVKINAAIPASAFEFTPPEGAKEGTNYFAALTDRLTGKSVDFPAAKAGPKPERPPSNYTPQAFVPDLHPTKRVDPIYPEAARPSKTQGMVDLLATIDPAGNVVDTEVLRGDAMLRQAAIDSLTQWHYRPVLRDGKAVYAYTSAVIEISDPNHLDPADASLTSISYEVDPSTDRLFGLMRTMPRTPQQELADMEQELGPVSGEERSVRLPELAKAALAAGALDKASDFANDMLKSGSKDFLYGELVYNGRMTLGLVALRQGNVALASQDLLESAKTPGSPMLDAMGPDFTLAKELLNKGEKSAVLEFLERCRTFWTKGAESLDAWSASIRSGGTPDFIRPMKF